MRLQRSIKGPFEHKGIGLHTGREVTLVIRPATINTGVIFIRKDTGKEVKASLTSVIDTKYSTSLGNNNIEVKTVEHLMAAIRGLNIDNLYVELDGCEVPIMDGSSIGFVRLFIEAGIVNQEAVQPHIKIISPIELTDGERRILIEPSPLPKLSYTISFEHPFLSSQSFSCYWSEDNFIKEIAPARTFTFLRDVETLWAHGLAKGGSLDNAIVFTDYQILNKGGLRYKDECVRHKILDLIGDLSLLGMPILGHIIATCSGHSLNIKLASRILKERKNWLVIDEIGPPLFNDKASLFSFHPTS